VSRAAQTRPSQSKHNAPRLSRDQVAANRAAARQWRIDNKPYFDALYGPEPTCACPREARS